MRTKNLTPYLAVTKLTSRHPPQPEMTLVVRGTFALRHGEPLRLVEGDPQLDQGQLSGERFADEDEEREGASLYPGDFADFKLNAEVMFVGQCHVPDEKPLAQCPVKIAVGDWHKTLQVFGPRRFEAGGGISKPEPFTTMPLDWAHAFGGPKDPLNPVGRGREGEELPNVELAYPLVKSRKDEVTPAGLSPISSNWPARLSKRGRNYGTDYLKKRAPYYSDDFDWRYFSAAPDDQQLDGYLNGDETLGLVNLHPEHAQLETSLPGTRLRAFVLDDRDDAREIRMVLDTVFIDTGVVDGEASEVRLSWRGLTSIREPDFIDLVAMLIAEEPLAEPPKPAEDYIAQLNAFAADPIGIKAFEDAVAAGDKAALVELAADGMDDESKKSLRVITEGAEPPHEALPDEVLPTNAISDLLAEELGTLARKQQAEINKGLAEVIALEIPPMAGADEANVAQARAGLDGADIAGKIDQAADDAKKEKDKPVPKDATGPTAPLPLGAKLKKLKSSITDSRSELEAIADRVEAEGHEFPREQLDELDALEAMLEDERLIAAIPGLSLDGIEPDELVPGCDLSGCDLTGRDLRGLDLRDVNFTHTALSEADLSGAKLQGSVFHGAVLVATKLEGADLTGADLTDANASGAFAARAILKETTLDRTVWTEADLSGANLEKAHAVQAILRGMNAAGTRMAGSRWTRCILSAAVLTKADLTEALLDGCILERCQANGARLRNAHMSNSSLSEAHLEGADLRGLRGNKAVFLGAHLEGADLRVAVLPGAHFSGSSLKGANLYGADLRRCRLYRCNLTGIQAKRCNLMEAKLGRADLSEADLREANLFGAKLLGAKGRDCRFDGANLRRARLNP